MHRLLTALQYDVQQKRVVLCASSLNAVLLQAKLDKLTVREQRLEQALEDQLKARQERASRAASTLHSDGTATPSGKFLPVCCSIH